MGEQGASVYDAVKEHILSEFLAGEDADALENSTPLISGGILDSISTVKLVSFLEERFEIEFGAHEISTDYLDTLTDIAAIVESKVAEKA